MEKRKQNPCFQQGVTISIQYHVNVPGGLCFRFCYLMDMFLCYEMSGDSATFVKYRIKFTVSKRRHLLPDLNVLLKVKLSFT